MEKSPRSSGTGAFEDAIASGFSMKSNRIPSVISRKKYRRKVVPNRLSLLKDNPFCESEIGPNSTPYARWCRIDERCEGPGGAAPGARHVCRGVRGRWRKTGKGGGRDG